ncbi:hypothetical protein F3J37_02955 [Pantoea sp. Al-1710]|jgi:hypothetical protein|uniref:Uncharacterized protein n=1 Tax=Candidatus Pantoea communis TaxID=2608354 RepID=A0ABX0RP17_9GAMM|nr:hypothetical protein [Pantoea communis]NIG17634.1 hypothetical protein [Pantoea communis]
MKHTPQSNADILNLHARTMQINGTVDEKVEQLRNMFAQSSKRTKDDRKLRGDREKVYYEG